MGFHFRFLANDLLQFNEKSREVQSNTNQLGDSNPTQIQFIWLIQSKWYLCNPPAFNTDFPFFSNYVYNLGMEDKFGKIYTKFSIVRQFWLKHILPSIKEIK